MASELQHKTFTGLIWTFFESFLLQFFGFIQGIILARLLMPSDFGLIAMTGIFFSISYTMIDSGFSNALMRKKEHEPIDYSTVYVTNITLSLFFSLALCASSSLIAGFFKQPMLEKIVWFNAFCMFIQSFLAVQGVRLRIQLNFRVISTINIVSTFITGIASIILAFMGFGVWSLIYPSILDITTKAFLYWYYQRWFPGLKFSMDKFREFFSYGSRIMASSLLNSVFVNIYPIIIGKCYSAQDLGYYNKASSYASLPATTATNILYKVTFTVLAKVNDDITTLEGVYRRMIRQSVFVVFPIMIGLAALAKPFVLLLITEKWAACIPLLQVLCFAMMWYPVHALNLNLLMIRGRSDLFLRLEIIKKIIIIIAVFSTFRLGIFCMAIGSVATSILSLFINTYYTGKIIKIGFGKQMRDIAPTLFYSLSMGIFIYVITLFISSLWLQLVIGIIVGTIYYLGIAKLTKSQDLQYAIDLLRENILKKS